MGGFFFAPFRREATGDAIPWMKKTLGIEIDGTSIKAAFVLEDGAMVGSFPLPIDKTLNQREMLNELLHWTKRKLEAHPDCIGVGVVCPGALVCEKT